MRRPGSRAREDRLVPSPRFRLRSRLALLRIAVGITATCLAAGCSTLIPDDTADGTRVENRRPSVRITAGAATADSVGIDYKVDFRWHGVDDDGLVAFYQYAIDDTVSENAWHDTTSFSSLFRMKATRSDSDGQALYDWHTFFVRAIDNEFGVSSSDFRTFNAKTIAPSSRITFPDVRSSEAPELLRTFVVRWEGDDLDSSRPDRKPVYYEYKLIAVGSPLEPDEVIRTKLHEAENLLLDTLRVGLKTAWIRVPESQRSLLLRELPIAASLCFAVRAVDEAGAIEPNLTRGRNFIAFNVRAANVAPFVTISEASIGTNEFPLGGDAEGFWTVSVPAGRPLRFRWTGDASAYGSLPGNSNYGLDLADPSDETIRDPRGIGGWIGWGRWAGNQEPFTFPASDGEATHVLIVKMRDISDAVSSERICKIRIKVVVFTFDKFALVVDDARFGANPSDLTHDAFLRQNFLARAPQLGQVDNFGLFGDGASEISVRTPRDLPLDLVSRYQHIFWSTHFNTFATQETGLHRTEISNARLSAYLGAGGRLFIFGSQLSSHLVGQELGLFGYPKAPPNNEIGASPEPGYVEESFLWKFLHYRTYVVGVPNRGDVSVEQQHASGLIGCRSLHPAYPDLLLDPAKFQPERLLDCGSDPNTCRYEGGTKEWEGLEGTLATTVTEAGLDSLYAARTFNRHWDAHAGRGVFIQSATDGAICAQRYESTLADTLSGSAQGRTILFAFQPYFFAPSGLFDAGVAAVNWLVTGKDN